MQYVAICIATYTGHQAQSIVVYLHYSHIAPLFPEAYQADGLKC